VKKYQVGLSVLTEGIGKEWVEQFLHSLEFDARPQVSYFVMPFDSRFCDMHTEYCGKKYFNRNKGHNHGIRILSEICEVVVCTDVDLLVPNGYLDTSYEIAINRPMNGVVRELPKSTSVRPRRWDEWMSIPGLKEGFGGWNAMTPEDWYKTGGWNETMYSWGMDKHLWLRMEAAGLKPVRFDRLPLVHVWHPKRNKDVQKIEPDIKRRVLDTMTINYLNKGD
jgi:hypothetical protein